MQNKKLQKEDLQLKTILDEKVKSFIQDKDFSYEVLDDIRNHYSNFLNYKISNKIGFGNSDLQDLHQEVWIKVIKYIKGKTKAFELDCEPNVYLKRLIEKTTHDICYDYLRRKEKQYKIFKEKGSTNTRKVHIDNEYEKSYDYILGGEVSTEELPDSLIYVKPNYESVLDFVMRPTFNSLSKKEQKTIYTLLWDDKSFEQAYKELGFNTPGACKIYLHRAKHKFYKELVEFTGELLKSPAHKTLLGRKIFEMIADIHYRALNGLT